MIFYIFVTYPVRWSRGENDQLNKEPVCRAVTGMLSSSWRVPVSSAVSSWISDNSQVVQNLLRLLCSLLSLEKFKIRYPKR